MLGELEDQKEANAAAQRRSDAATAQAAKLRMDLHALQQEAEQARQEANAQVSCRGHPGSLGGAQGFSHEQPGELLCLSLCASQSPAVLGV